MNGKYLLDTNILIAFFANEQAILTRIKNAEKIFIPSIAIGELHYGARKSVRTDANLTRINELVTRSLILPSDEETHIGTGL